LLHRGRAGGVERAAATNREIARQLDRVADLLEEIEANPFRIGSYRFAAGQLRALGRPVVELYGEGGRRRLETIPGVGRALSSSIAEIVETGRLRLLERLETDRSPVDAFRRLPGVGRMLAQRLHDELGVDTLEDLEAAAHDGRLAAVRGIGPKRVRGIRDALALRLSRRPGDPEPARQDGGARPSVGLLLDIDREYRWRARTGQLRRIAPRRFNPSGDAWLPIMELEREGWEISALYSNTQRAHDLGRTHDWVVIYYRRGVEHGQATVVTARVGVLRDLRVVRGREVECRRYYDEGRRIA